MMRVLSILGMASVGAAALSSNSPRTRREEDIRCMTSDEKDFMVEIYRQSIAEFTEELGEKYISKDFVDISDSINTFTHKPLGGPTFPSKEVFLESQLYGPHFPIEILTVDAHDCNTVALQWVASFGAANLPSKGITILKTVWEDDTWKILSIEVEFNALTWLLNMGGSYTWEGKTFTAENPDPALVPQLEEDEDDAE